MNARENHDRICCFETESLFFPGGGWKGEKKAKGVKKCVVKKELKHKNFVNCLLTGEREIRKQNVIRSREHHIFTETIEKIALSADDDKRVVLENGIDTLALGHWRLR